MNNIITNYINIMKKEDIINFAKKNNLKVTDSEIDFIYTFIKNNHEYYLKNPNELDISKYKDKFSNDNYNFLINLFNKLFKKL